MKTTIPVCPFLTLCYVLQISLLIKLQTELRPLHKTPANYFSRSREFCKNTFQIHEGLSYLSMFFPFFFKLLCRGLSFNRLLQESCSAMYETLTQKRLSPKGWHPCCSRFTNVQCETGKGGLHFRPCPVSQTCLSAITCF